MPTTTELSPKSIYNFAPHYSSLSKERWEKIEFMAVAGTAASISPKEIGWIHKPQRSTSVFFASEKSDLDVTSLSPAEQIRLIRETLSLNMSQMAELMEVTRPTAYRWLDGKESDRGETAGKIKSLAVETKKIKDMNIPRVDLLLKRPLFEGKSLFDLLIENKDISHELEELKSIGDREEETRQSSKIPHEKKNFSRILEAADELSTPIFFEETI